MNRRGIVRAMQPSPWDTTNAVLYRLCREMPSHTDRAVIMAKVNLIGRAYAAAIERRRVSAGSAKDERFYESTVAPRIQRSGIDSWVAGAKTAKPGSETGFQVMIEVHGAVTSLFSEISGHEKRSLASKYLHFHVPHLFFIYDSRAAQAIREHSDILPRAARSAGAGDNEYRKFAEKCYHLVEYVAERYRLHMSPRQLDNLLLRVNEK